TGPSRKRARVQSRVAPPVSRRAAALQAAHLAAGRLVAQRLPQLKSKKVWQARPTFSCKARPVRKQSSTRAPLKGRVALVVTVRGVARALVAQQARKTPTRHWLIWTEQRG